MFRSIEYRLITYICLLILFTAAATFCFIIQEYIYGPLCILIMIFCLNRIYKNYSKFNQNILFLLNALDNGDYSFNFAETKMSKREEELNRMMNRIKDILTKARKEVIENEKFLSLIVESVPTGIIILDQHNNILTTNRAINDILGMPVLTHLKQLKVLDETLPELFRDLDVNDNKTIKIANEREEKEISLRVSKITLKLGTLRIISLNSIGNELEAKEMESWVKLIRVMTHEIMNSIAPITSLTDTLLFSYKMAEANQDDELRENTVDALETISSTAKGLMVFVQSYRKFTGVPKPELREIDLLPIVENVVSLEMSAMEEKGVNLNITSDMPSAVINADESQITQVLVNLVKNAIEALDTDKEREIRININHTGDRTHIDVSNNGSPIPPEVVSSIFIPFFTTKDTGTGIGLSISRYIMRLHGGNLKHYTKDGWTVFSMIF
ncbi:PAS domain-containing sensor histidine kinase [Prevotella sp. 10(H)]|uniref:sensor histidine kinase n=1 Tax=Prevotella sp. 10(H) TaxID=1158294 RepID=UPI0004A6DF1A|nr:ATP-binding protein [Prevotella sp. 10(H)]